MARTILRISFDMVIHDEQRVIVEQFQEHNDLKALEVSPIIPGSQNTILDGRDKVPRHMTTLSTFENEFYRDISIMDGFYDSLDFVFVSQQGLMVH